MKEKELQQKEGLARLLPLLLFCGALLLTLGTLAVVFRRLYPGIIGRAPSFFDLIIEDTAINGFDKAGEITLFRILALAGLLTMTAAGFLAARLSQKLSSDSAVLDPDVSPAAKDPAAAGADLFSSPLAPLLWVIPAAIYFVIDGVVSRPLLFMSIYSLVAGAVRWMKQRRALAGAAGNAAESAISPAVVTLLPILAYYAVLGLCTLCSFVTQFFLRPDGSVSLPLDVTQLSQEWLYIAALILTYLFLSLRPLSERSRERLLVCLQLPIPLLLFVFLHDRYLYEGRILQLSYAPGYYILIGLLLTASYAGIFFLRKKGPALAVTPVLIFLYQSYQACPMFAQPDQHHHGEQLIPWEQIISLGQGAYKTYTPVSGLFPMVNGFLQHVLLGGTVSDYAPAIALTTVLFAAITMILLVMHLGAEKALLFAVLFAIPSYNRQYMVLPLLLLLFLPSLQKRPLTWLSVWLFGCFLGGLYYPLFGAAVAVGTLPLCIRQLFSLKNASKQKREWLLLGAVCVPVLCSLPLLLRMAVHTLTYSSQTILADGISLAGQSAPETFLSALPIGKEMRDSLYLLYRFFLPALWLWIPGFCAGASVLRSLKTRKWNTTLGFCGVLLTLAVSYSYTLIRADRGVLLARTAPVLIAAGMFTGMLLLGRQSRLCPLQTLLAGLCLSLPLCCYAHVNDMKTPYLWTYPNGNDQLVAEDASKLFSFYEVPAGFAPLLEAPGADHLPLGSGFMAEDQFSYLEAYDRIHALLSSQNPDADLSYMGYDGQGFYYYLHTKACATGYLPVARSYKAQEEILQVARSMRPVILPLDPQKSFYIYRWLLSDTAGYRYSADLNIFYPEELTLPGDAAASNAVSPADTRRDYLLSEDPYAGPASFGAVCMHFGSSVDALQKSGSIRPAGQEPPISGETQELLSLPLSDDAWKSAGVSLQELAGAQGPLTLSVSLQHTYSFSDGSKAQDWEIADCDIPLPENDADTLLIPLSMSPRWYLAGDIAPEAIRLSITNENGQVLITCPLTDLSGYSFYSCRSDGAS
ncbi:MAG: hypothetical protein K6E18_01440 [Lachnospiraceae bacterium]|nr:hypothetical protein [Lachnospiraceae bacterium]